MHCVEGDAVISDEDKGEDDIFDDSLKFDDRFKTGEYELDRYLLKFKNRRRREAIDQLIDDEQGLSPFKAAVEKDFSERDMKRTIDRASSRGRSVGRGGRGRSLGRGRSVGRARVARQRNVKDEGEKKEGNKRERSRRGRQSPKDEDKNSKESHKTSPKDNYPNSQEHGDPNFAGFEDDMEASLNP